jgi:hypothetical protein
MSHVARNQCPVPKRPYLFLNEVDYHGVSSVCIPGSIEKELMTNLDIYLFDAHDNAMYHWLKKLDRTKKYTLVHIDSHNDLDYPRKLTKEMFESNHTDWAKDAKIHIGNFIMPFVYAGIIDKIIWLKPEWENVNVCRDKFQVGNIPGSTRVASNSNLYFMEFHNQIPLENAQNVTLEVLSINRFKCPDMKIRNDNILLDIDLDYFSTQNPLEKWLYSEFGLTQPQIFRLASIFDTNSFCWNRVNELPTGLLDNFEPMSTTDSYSKIINKMHTLLHVLMAQFFPQRGKRIISDEEFLQAMSYIMHLWCVEGEEMPPILLDVKHLIEASHRTDRSEYYSKTHPHVGLPSVLRMLDSIVNLPHHYGNTVEMEEMKRDLFLWLEINGINKENPKKPIITIAKSQADGHSYSHLVDYVQNNIVYDILYRLYH